MKWFQRKGARETARPPLARARPLWGVDGGVSAGQPRARDIQDAYLNNPVAQRAVRIVAEAVGSAPLRASSAALLSLVRTTSAGQTLTEALASHLLLNGNAYVQILTDSAGAPVELFALRPDRMSAEVDARGWPVAYRYRLGGQTIRLAAEDGAGRPAVVQIKLFNPLDDHEGASCLSAAALPVAAHNAASAWNRALLDNAARPSGALVHDPGDKGMPLSTEQYERLRDELAQGFSGAGNAGRPLLLEGGLKWQTMSLSPHDMDFLSLKEASAREIACAFGVPPMLVGIRGDATYANFREASRALWRLTVLPLADKILSAIAQGLRAWDSEAALSVDVNRITALAEERAQLWQQIGKADFLSPEEKRRMLGIESAAAV